MTSDISTSVTFQVSAALVCMFPLIAYCFSLFWVTILKPHHFPNISFRLFYKP